MSDLLEKSAFYFLVQLIAEKAPRCLRSLLGLCEMKLPLCVAFFKLVSWVWGEIVAMSMVVMCKADGKRQPKKNFNLKFCFIEAIRS